MGDEASGGGDVHVIKSSDEEICSRDVSRCLVKSRDKETLKKGPVGPVYAEFSYYE